MQLKGFADDLAALASKGPAFASDVLAVINRVSPYLGTVRAVVDDPAFPTVMQRIQTIADLEATSSSGGSSSVPSTPSKTGVGLTRAVPLLDAYIYVRRNPWAGWLAIGGAIAVIGGIGYRMGTRKRMGTP